MPPHLQVVPVPSHFRCPISLHIMRDPVCLFTGVTYDCQSIQKWLDNGHNPCPATMQVLSDQQLIPNHTLRRLIQEWGALNTSHGFQRIPTPQPPAEPHTVRSMLRDIVSGSSTSLSLLKCLRDQANASDRNRRCMASEGIIAVLMDLIARVPQHSDLESVQVSQEALDTLVLFTLDEAAKKSFRSTHFMSISWLLRKAISMETRVHASILLENVCADKVAAARIASTEGVIEGLVALVKDSLCRSAVKSGLKALLALSSPLRIRKAIVETEAVAAVVEAMAGASRSTREHAVAVLSRLSSCAEGRASITSHALAIPAIVGSISGVSDLTSEHCVEVLWLICLHVSSQKLLQDLIQLGIIKSLLMLLQVDSNLKTKQRIKDLLRLFNRNSCSTIC